MRCDCCPLSDQEDVCPEADGSHGLEHKDGVLGCTHSWSWVKKRDDVSDDFFCALAERKDVNER